ncbi:MAG TPA: hypothetical protein VJY33_01660 [Isosphaeraceae bacterium]|nr:hypothetical protein [Isosphaeraceae bacterium]
MLEPMLIQPDALYDDNELRMALGISPTSLTLARRSGKLRYTRPGQRTLYRGAWILDWLEATATGPGTIAGKAVIS